MAAPICKILLVDDDPAIVELFSLMLRMEGHEVVTARSGEDALYTWAQYGGDFDILVTDFWMPGIKGDALARHLCERSSRLQCAIVTGHDSSELALDGLEGRVAVLRKPLKQGILAAKVADLHSARNANSLATGTHRQP